MPPQLSVLLALSLLTPHYRSPEPRFFLPCCPCFPLVSVMMHAHPELTAEALNIHNALVRKAKWTNIGFTVEQEGGKHQPPMGKEGSRVGIEQEGEEGENKVAGGTRDWLQR